MPNGPSGHLEPKVRYPNSSVRLKGKKNNLGTPQYCWRQERILHIPCPKPALASMSFSWGHTRTAYCVSRRSTRTLSSLNECLSSQISLDGHIRYIGISWLCTILNELGLYQVFPTLNRSRHDELTIRPPPHVRHPTNLKSPILFRLS